jgi:hypothetical protein
MREECVVCVRCVERERGERRDRDMTPEGRRGKGESE